MKMPLYYKLYYVLPECKYVNICVLLVHMCTQYMYMYVVHIHVHGCICFAQHIHMHIHTLCCKYVSTWFELLIPSPHLNFWDQIFYTHFQFVPSASRGWICVCWYDGNLYLYKKRRVKLFLLFFIMYVYYMYD